MTTTPNDSLNILLELARRVRSQQGVKLYNKPIGSLITDADTQGGAAGTPGARAAAVEDVKPNKRISPDDINDVKDSGDATRAPSLVRLQSLLQQVKKASKQGDESQANLLRKELTKAISAYAKGKDPKDVLAKLEGLGS